MGVSQAKPSGEIDVSQPDRQRLTEDELFELLANQRRRHIMHALMREDARLDIGDLSQEIAAWEDGLAFEDVSSTDRKRVYTALQQSHLPKMDKAGVVEFDRDRGTIEPTPALEDVEIYMDVVRGREIPWSDYYLGLTALSGALFVTSTLDLLPFSQLPAAAWGVFVIVTFAVSALAHRYYARRSRLGIAEQPPSVELEYRDRPTDE
ncbi:DUF7344 domain-containing protein [Natrinema salinisoli]|uniref:DUF7344 domain-containing protein n=1 Tax=Natrinema salinisoli TaxID=2878535 RepID=UPI001CEFC0C8|nr:DUF308 domain-containing protein [Natrinema salinisoli]